MVTRKAPKRQKRVRRDDGVNPLIVALGAGAGAASGAGMAGRAAAKTRARVPAVAKKMADTATRRFESERMSAQYYGGKAGDYEGSASAIRNRAARSYRRLPGEEIGRMLDLEGNARENRQRQRVANSAAEKVKTSRKMDLMGNQNRLESGLDAIGSKASNRRTKRMAAKGGAAGGALAVLAQLVAAEMSKKKKK